MPATSPHAVAQGRSASAKPAQDRTNSNKNRTQSNKIEQTNLRKPVKIWPQLIKIDRPDCAIPSKTLEIGVRTGRRKKSDLTAH